MTRSRNASSDCFLRQVVVHPTVWRRAVVAVQWRCEQTEFIEAAALGVADAGWGACSLAWSRVQPFTCA